MVDRNVIKKPCSCWFTVLYIAFLSCVVALLWDLEAATEQYINITKGLAA